MKIKKMVGAVALTAALAMGSVPAFATSGAPTGSVDATAGTTEFSDNASTEIKANVQNYDANVRATVPLKVVVVFGSTGEQDIVGPSSASYYIENVGADDIKVTNAEITDVNSTFTTDGIRYVGNVWYDSSNNKITSGNYLMFTYKTTGNNAFLSDKHSLKASSVLNDSNYLTDVKDFTEETIASGDKLNIELAGKGYFCDDLQRGEMTDTLCNIKYTISAAK